MKPLDCVGTTTGVGKHDFQPSGEIVHGAVQVPEASEVKIDPHILSQILLCAFRYSLGRMTYITGDCADWLTRYWHLIPAAWQEQIHGDILKAIEQGHAGHECDIRQWKRVLSLPLNQGKTP
jgi:hypothetical protein